MDPRPGSSGPAGRESGWAGLHGEEMGPARPLGGGTVVLGGPLMMIVCAYIGSYDHTRTNAPDPIRTPQCDHTSTNAPDPIRTPHTSFLPVLPAVDPRPGSSAPAGRASGRAGLNGEEMGPAMPLGGGAVALGGPLMIIVCAYIGRCDHTSTNAPDPVRTPDTSFLPVLPAADPRPGSSAPAGRASGRAGLHGEEMGLARPFCGGAVALGGAVMMIVCAYIGRCDHTSANAPDPVRTPHTSFLPLLPAADTRAGGSTPGGRASGRAGLHGEGMGPASPLGGGAVAVGGALMMIGCAYIGRLDHTRTNAPDPIRTPQLSVLGPSSRKLGSGGSGIRMSGAPWRGDGPREASRWRHRCPRRPAYDDCVRIHRENSSVKRAWARVVLGWVTSWEVLMLHLFFSTSFLPVLPDADPRPGSSAPAGRASGRAGLHREEMGPARPLGGGVVALRGAVMMIVCAYIGRCDHTSTNAPDPVRTPQLSVLGRDTSFLPLLPAADPRAGSSTPGGRAFGRAGLHGEGMGPASHLGGGAVAVGGALMMIVCAYIGRLDHTSTNASDPIRTPQLSTLVPEARLRRVGHPDGRGSMARRWAPRGLSVAATLPSEARL
ncbi:hypothetical protein PIB30_089868 [Stylosanthes scabra]|uniref:Uncharacterized protein n=1 Tax=Stylosanthes scabra TaxID=79078 RepID=A0ABU6XT60_9FABA|nr:hypothetical protein [Stylosanthes scabra]